jgi:SAM-dependent methyltransferase
MDLGCGPGQLARAFAPIAGEIVALDPEPEMLRVAQAASAGFGNIDWRSGGSDDLSPALGRFRLVCMGRSFHWMDRPETLRRLDGIIEPGGAVALFHDTHPELPDNGWYGGYREILQRYSGDGSFRARRQVSGWVRHEGVLLDSAFARIEQIGVYERRETSVDVLVERALSMSSTSRARLGERADEMIAELRASLPPGDLREVIASQATLAWRP